MTTETAARVVRAPRGLNLSCRSWQQEAALRMLMNNLDPEVAERPQELVVYGGIGKAARNWPPRYDAQRASHTRATLGNVLETCLEFAAAGTAGRRQA